MTKLILNCLFMLLALAGLTGCELRQAMYDQPKLKPLQASTFFTNGMASRPLIEGTIARGHLENDPHLFEGKINGELVTNFPFEITSEVINRGRERYNIFCSPCHDQSGYGNGMIVRRGFKRPTSFHDQRLVDSPPGYFYNVINNGFGVMQDYSAQIPVKDRWAIVSYIRALQYSQRANLQDVPESLRAEIKPE